MNRPRHSKPAGSPPPQNGGVSVWLYLLMAVFAIAGIVHLAKPAVSSKEHESNEAASQPRFHFQPEHHPVVSVENPCASRFDIFVRAWENEPDIYQQETMISALVAEVGADEMPDMLTSLRFATPKELAQDLSSRLIRKWTGLDPHRATAWIATLPIEMQATFVSDVAIVWADNQPTNAVAWAGSLRAPALRNQALAQIAGEAVRSQPMLALQIAVDLPADEQRDELIRRGATQWAAEDAQGAATWAAQIAPSDLRDQVISGIAIEWSTTDPATAATTALDELPLGRRLEDTLVSIVQRWAQRDPAAVAAWVEQFPDGPLRMAAMENLLNQWSQADADAARQWQSTHS